MPDKSRLRGKTILVVDDHADTRELLRQALESLGATVRTATSGEDALTFLTAQVPELILLDLLMPGMDGLTVMKRLRADPRLAAVPVVAVTALGMDADYKLTGEAGFEGHVSKPFDLEGLASVLERVLRARRS
jgi:two-component system, chemotaxis family, CheB/CheR fusion protein